MTTSDAPDEYQSGGDDDLMIRRIRAQGPRSGTIGPRPDHVVFWLADGHARLTDDDGGTWEVGPERPMMLSAPVAYGFETDATAMTLVHLSPSLLGDAEEPWEFRQPDAGDPATEPLRALLRDVAGRVLDPMLPDDERAALNRRIATVVLSTFTRGRSDVANRMRRAIRFVHERAGDPITVADVADACGLSARGLQDLFRRRLGVTPVQYLREVRLDRVHLVLRGSRAGSVTVGEVARRWQFAHLGRFAANYRARFGERPHETVARAGNTVRRAG